jgi:hypothetical protein
MMRKKVFLTNRLMLVFLLLGIQITGCDSNEPLSDTKEISSFTIGAAEGIINGQTITITVPYGTDLSSLAPHIEFTGSTVSPASGALQNFTEPVIYRVTAADGSTRDYTVVVRHAASNIKAITSFTIGDAAGIISGQTIAITVPYDTNITALAPVILFTGSTVSPASEAPEDFTGPVTYRVTAGDGSFMDYVAVVQLKGRPPIEISFTSLPYEKIDLTPDSENDLSRIQKDTLQITVADTPVHWFIDGNKQSVIGGTITVSAVDYPVGIHHVTALVYKNEIPYSDELIFKVVK